MTANPEAQVAEKWSKVEPDVAKNFFGFPLLRPHLIRSAFGEEMVARHRDNRWWAEDIIIEKYVRPMAPQRVLSLCCGFGAVEQHFVGQLGTVEYCKAVDLAGGAIEEARRRAGERGLDRIINYEVADLNRYAWGQEKFDLVIANGALHHLANLEEVIPGIVGSLARGGALYANEHVGARHQDFPPRQIELINAVAYLVPPELRSRRPVLPGKSRLAYLGNLLAGNIHVPDEPSGTWRARLRAQVWRALIPACRRDPGVGFGVLQKSNRELWLATDPSEGAGSDRIIPLIRRHFREATIHEYGGGTLAYALDRKFYAAFDADNAQHCALIERLCAVEAMLMKSGELAPEHAMIFARP